MSEKFYTIEDGKTYLSVRVTPKSSKNAIVGVREGNLLIMVTTVPEKNQANESVIKVLSKELKIAKSKMQIVSGAKGKNKIVCIDEEVSEALFEKYCLA